ncbi:MAG: cbb3-type cytochrome oxidase assembly protein CcoS [Pseudomonadota bacterium]
MDILFLLIPVSVLLGLGVLGVLAWAVWSGQFEELESEGVRILGSDTAEPPLPATDREA